MGYLHIENLYKNQTILLFKECYALEKIHGTSAHVAYMPGVGDGLRLFSGGESYERFIALFDQSKLAAAFKEIEVPNKEIIIFGEAYGGKQQGMSDTYGKDLKFCVFDVKIGDCWLDVPNAEQVAQKLGLEFVPWARVPTTLESLNAERDRDSDIAIRRGVGLGKHREGVVLRPLVEMTTNNGARVIAKHKRDEFRETKTPRVVDDPAKLAKLAEAEAVATEWVTLPRLEHVLDKLPGHDISQMPRIMAAMLDDVIREADGEIDQSGDGKQIEKAIRSRTAMLYKERMKASLYQAA